MQQELNFKKPLTSVLLFLIGIIACSALSLLHLAHMEIPLPVITLGFFAGYLLCTFIFQPGATTGQSMQITIMGIVIAALTLLASSYCVGFIGLTDISIKTDFILSINPLSLGISFFAGLIVSNKLMKLEKVNPEKPVPQIKEEQKTATGVNITGLNKNDGLETVPFSVKQDTPNIMEKEDSGEDFPPSEPKNLYEEIYPQKTSKETPNKSEELYFEDFTAKEIKNAPQNYILPSLKEENILDLNQVQSNAEKYQPRNINPENPDFIPTNIRLIETPTVRESETKGKMASIGKLLVNNKDIENLILNNETAREGSSNGKTNIISDISGQKIYEKFSEIKKEHSQIKEMALIDKGGFILATNFEDKQKAQITGALVAGAYHTLQNYLVQLSLDLPVRIFFKTENALSFIYKTSNELLFATCDKDFSMIEYGPIAEVLEAGNLYEINLTPYADLMKIEKFTMSDIDGRMLNSLDNSDESHNFCAVSSAVLENLKVFLMNIQLYKLSKIFIFTSEKVLTIYKNDTTIASLLTPIDEFPKISESLLNMEEIY
jgi:predicted regulator of Ras-like GTPase activity (Roadblock/LC7/MglB family)